MDVMDWLVTAAGVALVLLVLGDALLTVLHTDLEGFTLRTVRTVTWSVLVFIAARVAPARRRLMLSMAGPVMLTATFASWIGLFLFGFALVFLPQMESGYRSVDGLRDLGFVDALYYSGSTGTVLGYGDITPITSPLKTLAVVQAAVGFALFTGILTYMINILGGVAERSALAYRLHAVTAYSGDGTEAILRLLPGDRHDHIAVRLHVLAADLAELRERMHQYPVNDHGY